MSKPRSKTLRARKSVALTDAQSETVKLRAGYHGLTEGEYLRVLIEDAIEYEDNTDLVIGSIGDRTVEELSDIWARVLLDFSHKRLLSLRQRLVEARQRRR